MTLNECDSTIRVARSLVVADGSIQFEIRLEEQHFLCLVVPVRPVLSNQFHGFQKLFLLMLGQLRMPTNRLLVQ